MPSFVTTLPPGGSLDLADVPVVVVIVERVTKSGVTVRVFPRDPDAVLRPAGKAKGGKLRLTVWRAPLQLEPETQ